MMHEGSVDVQSLRWTNLKMAEHEFVSQHLEGTWSGLDATNFEKGAFNEDEKEAPEVNMWTFILNMTSNTKACAH